MLQRIQLMLDYQTKKELKRLANAKNRSMSDLTREILQKSLKKSSRNISGTNFLLKLSAKAVDGPGDSDYDKYAYEQDK